MCIAGKFNVKWIYVKDVPNSQLRHIRLENNENKPVTNSRDTQVKILYVYYSRKNVHPEKKFISDHN